MRILLCRNFEAVVTVVRSRSRSLQTGRVSLPSPARNSPTVATTLEAFPRSSRCSCDSRLQDVGSKDCITQADRSAQRRDEESWCIHGCGRGCGHAANGELVQEDNHQVPLTSIRLPVVQSLTSAAIPSRPRRHEMFPAGSVREAQRPSTRQVSRRLAIPRKMCLLQR